MEIQELRCLGFEETGKEKAQYIERKKKKRKTNKWDQKIKVSAIYYGCICCAIVIVKTAMNTLRMKKNTAPATSRGKEYYEHQK